MVRAHALPTIVANTSFRLAPWADAIFAMDAMWWEEYAKELLESGFRGMKFGAGPAHLGVEPTKGRLYPPGFGNSGSYAASLGIVSGAARVLLLGYDCQFSGGKKHWHPDHPGKMGNATSIKRWPYQFQLIAKYAETHHCRIVNCSRETALHCFPRASLADELARGE